MSQALEVLFKETNHNDCKKSMKLLKLVYEKEYTNTKRKITLVSSGEDYFKQYCIYDGKNQYYTT